MFNMLKKFQWVTIIVAVVLAYKFKDEVFSFLDDKAPSIANFVKPESEKS